MESFLFLLCILPIAVVQSAYTDCNCQKVDGGLTEWTQFSPCSASCGPGTQTRVRYCTNPYPQFGGKDCTGKLSDSKSCNLKPCPVNGGWSPEKQGACTKPCGGGQATITRTCTNPPPSACGRKCTGWASKVVPCNIQACPKPVWGQFTCGYCNKQTCVRKCTRKCLLNGVEVSINRCPREQYGDHKFEKCCIPNDDTGCEGCYNRALHDAKKQQTAYWKANFVGHACRAPHLVSRCKTSTTSKNGGLPSNNWFWIHCSPDGPWCKPCATRGLVFNKRCDACESTKDGPCSGK